MPLLSIVLDLEIPDNDFTKTLEPKYRRARCGHCSKIACRAAAKDEPPLIVIEDLHWIDALSHDLLEELAKALANYPRVFRAGVPPAATGAAGNAAARSPAAFTQIELHELTHAEAERPSAPNWRSCILARWRSVA